MVTERTSVRPRRSTGNGSQLRWIVAVGRRTARPHLGVGTERTGILAAGSESQSRTEAAIALDGRDYPVRTVERFDARINDENALVYTFDIPLDVPIGPKPVSLRVSMYDETFFTDFAYEPREISVNAAGMNIVQRFPYAR